MPGSSRIHHHILEGIHYISIPAPLSGADVVQIENQWIQWKALVAEMHVLDLKGLTSADDRFFKAIQSFKNALGAVRLVSINVTEELYREIERRKLEAVFGRVRVFPDDLNKARKLSPAETQRLLIRYLIRSAYAAVEVALQSTVSCDENYLAKFDKVPFSDFDLVAIVDARTESLTVQIRLCATTVVLRKLASAMVGTSSVDNDMIESMASELLNMIYGGAKSKLNNEESFRLPPVIPRLVRRPQTLEIKRNPQNTSILPLVTPMGSFYVEVDLSPN